MKGSILQVHYTPPGVIGGVEHIIQQHSVLLSDRGYQVEVAAGRKGRSRFPVHVIPEMDAARPANFRIERQLEEGLVSEQFSAHRQAIRERLAPLMERADWVIVHNAFTLHFCLPLTAALWDLAPRRAAGSTIAWCHDLAWTNPLYIPVMYEGFPWDLLRNPAPNTAYACVSEERKVELSALWDGKGPSIVVVPNGIDVGRFLRVSAQTEDIARRYRLFDRDAVLLLPVRITRRKNIEAGIRAVRALKERGLDVCFLISGPVAPHHPARSIAYLRSLIELRDSLDLHDEVVFLAEDLGRRLPDRTVSELYTISDALLFPSAQEGFGIPILEAGLTRTPAVLSRIPIFEELGGDEVLTFALDSDPDTIAQTIERALNAPPSRLFRRVLRHYRWDAIVDRHILPLLIRDHDQRPCP